MPQLPVQAIAIRPAVAGAAAVVDVEHGEAAAGPELDLRIEHIRRRAGRTAVGDHQQRRPLAGRRLDVRDWSAGSRTRAPRDRRP